ncbi:N utilization substance protein B homolog [Candidatus Filomicrobium marinum]|uniref:Transcription antitermination protein NusB n=2 Tax=Filomicrobium TaxID=119044 RepID=A0A0D6JGV6_9HYPH|nr:MULTISPECIES: transcription antitermination factor NusB [Filomicrobium]CFX48975.1 N utilization substance protein B homolog [Candidatus Filomicrobium marinum]CPR20380.1 N utilization substance protein B homolog [Candidatus Filomicrobium marinum]SDP14180.1 NusB antitermination factor [Filomicrobium insigne]
MTVKPRKVVRRASGKATGSANRAARSAGRMAAVQALYQMDLAGTDVTDVIHEFTTLRFPTEETEANPAEETTEPKTPATDAAFFAELVRGVVRRQRDIDPMIDHQLALNWRLKRVDSTLRAILRAGAFELIERRDIPARVVINEYIEVAHAFFDDDEPKVANGVLDRLARRLRVSEFEMRRTSPQDKNEPPADTEPDPSPDRANG